MISDIGADLGDLSSPEVVFVSQLVVESVHVAVCVAADEHAVVREHLVVGEALVVVVVGGGQQVLHFLVCYFTVVG